MPVFAAPIAVDDEIAVPSNTPVFSNDIASNDTNLPTDIYTITVPPSNGTAILTVDGLLDYTPNIGFASTDSLTYSVDDGAGGSDTATVTFNVLLSSEFLTPASNFLIGQEDVPTPLNLSVDPSLEYGGTLQDIIGVDGLYRAETQTGIPVASTIPAGTTGINITGYATRNVGTNQTDEYNDDYQLFSANVDLREGTYSGRLTYSIAPHEANAQIDQYTWLNVPLGQSILSDTAFVSGHWTGASDPLIELVSGEIRITETIPLQIAYHIEYMTADGDSTDFVSGSGDVQKPNDSQSSFTIPSQLEPTDGSKQGYVVLTGYSAADGSNFAEEHKGFSRLVINLETNTVSGVIASERGELDSLVTTWSFLDYPLVDLRITPASTPVSITNSTATLFGDTTAAGTVNADGIEDDPTVYIDASGTLIVERALAHAGAFTTMYTSENYLRTGLSSIASFVGVESDTSLFDSDPPDGVDNNGKPVNIQSFAIPASSSIGIVQMSWQTIGGSATNENVGYGFSVIDLNANTSSGSITFSRTTTPDLLAWQGVPIGTTLFGATDGGVALYQSNKDPGDFTDDYPETARFTIVNNADGSRTLEFTATSSAGTGSYADYIGTTQVSWLGSEPFRVEGVPGTGVLSHGSPTDQGWEVDFADIPSLAISTNEHGTGELELNLLLSSTGEADTIIVHVQPVVDDPVLTASDALGYVGNPVSLNLSISDSADVDGSETQPQTLTLTGVPTSVSLSADTGSVTNFGGGNWQIDRSSISTLTATSPSSTTATVTLSTTNTDTHDLDGDNVIEDGNNGSGVDELDTATYQETFDLNILNVPAVTAQVSSTGTPVISGTATIGAGESLSVTVNGITYIDGDGNLVSNGDGTWDLSIPVDNTIPDGTYFVTASLSHVDGSSGADTTTDELVVDATPPATPTVNALNTSDATPMLSGTATVGQGETLTVSVDGTTYSAGDGNLSNNGDGTWTLSISSPLSEGTYNVTAIITDTAGNSSPDVTANELVVEATPLSTPTVEPQVTSDTTPIISGNAAVGNGDSLTVSVDGVTYTPGDGKLVYNSSSEWTLSISTAIADGTYEVIAVVTDVFGNTYIDTSSNELIVDTTAPSIPTIVSQITNNASPTIVGTTTTNLDESLSVELAGTTYTNGDGHLIVQSDGSWELSVPVVLAETVYEIKATITDTAGNATSDNTANELTIDITAPVFPTVNAQITSNPTPLITGTASVGTNETLSVSVSGVTYTAGDGVLIDNGDGSWELLIPSALADGVYSLSATISDIAGNVSTDISIDELTIDTTAPVVPTVASQSTNNTTPDIQGTATISAGDILTVTVDGNNYVAGDGHLSNNGDGTWALSIPIPLDQGTYNVTTTVTDAAGNATTDSTSSELIVDLTAPVAPGVTSLATTDTTPTIIGTATLGPDEVLSVEVDGVVYTAGEGDLVDNNDGTWALTIPATNILAENLYQVVARVTDAAGNSALDSGVDDLLIDLTAPIAPGVTSITTNDTTPDLEGTAVVLAGETLSVIVNGVTYTAGDGNLTDNGDGTWNLSIPTTLAEGLYDITALTTDAAGNTSLDPSSSELLIDTTLPITPTVTPQFTVDTTPVIQGTANPGPGESLIVVVDNATYTVGDGNLLDHGDGTWSLSISTPMADGTYEVEATVIDAAGNHSIDTNSDELIIDTSAPVTPTVNALITNVSTPTISGTTSTVAGEKLTVSVNGITYTEGDTHLVVNNDGSWYLNIPVVNAIPDGTFEVIATITDLAGNTSNDVSNDELTMDTAAPQTPTVTAQTTSDNTPTITGTATVPAGEVLTVTVNGITYTAGDGHLVDNGNGTWVLNIPASLIDSNYPITVSVTDAAGNVSNDTTTGELTIDTTAPVIPTVTTQITSNTTPVITGTATVGSDESLTVTLDGNIYTAGDGNLVDNGDGTWELNVPVTMIDNEYDVIATVVDIAGNTSSDTTASELTIDTMAPGIPSVGSQLTNDTTPIIQGNAVVAAGEVLRVSVDNINYTAGDGFLVDHGDGTWSLSVGTALADGVYDVIATVTDEAGNTSSDITTDELTIDTTPPTTPAVVSQNTNNTSPTLTGTASVAPTDTLSVAVDGTTYLAGDGHLTDNTDGTWTLTLPVTLTENTYNVTAMVTDLAGNPATDTTASELVIDLTAPQPPGVTSLSTSDITPSIEIIAAVGSGETLSVQLNGETYTEGTDLVDNGDGTWTLTVPNTNNLAEILYQVVATIEDTAGNSSTDPGVDDLLIDLTAPIAPGVTSQSTNNTSPVIKGTAVLAPGESLSVTVNGITYNAGDGNLVDNGNGTWNLSISSALAEGVYDVTASITDSAGNTSSDPSSSELLIDITLPTLPSVTALITSVNTPVITGTAITGPDETLRVTVDGVTYASGDGHLVEHGDDTWSLTIPNPVTDGVYHVDATITDNAGNTSTDTSSSELVIDTTAPAIPTVESKYTSNTTPAITGTAVVATNEMLQVSIDGITYTAGDINLVDNNDGTWTLTLSSALAEGTYDVTATVTDIANNISTDLTASELTIDTTVPVVPSVENQTTNNNTPTLIGTATVEPGEILSVSVNGVTYTAGDGNLTDNGDGSWALIIPAALTDATYQVQVSVVDEAGNTSIDASMEELIIDTVAPVEPTVLSQTTNDTTPVITVTAVVGNGESLSVIVNGTTYTVGDGNLFDTGNDTWTLNIPTPLVEDTYDVSVTINDLAGNSSSDASIAELIIDLTPPATPTVTALTTNNTTPTIEGTAIVAAGESLSVTVDGITYTAGDGFLSDNGNSTWTLSLPTPLAEATYDVTASVSDTAGNTSSDLMTAELVIDTTLPVIPTVAYQTTNITTPTLAGTATVEPGEVLSVSVDGVIYTVGDGNLADTGNNTWTLTISAPLAEGTYDVTATVVDLAGNVSSDTTTTELIIDLTLPVIPTVSALITNINTPTLVGTAIVEPGEVLSISVDGVSYTAGDGKLSDNGDGTWSLAIPTALANATYQVAVFVTDEAGNTSIDTSAEELIIDTVAPVEPTVLSQITNNPTPVISGRAIVGIGESLSVIVNGVTYAIGDGNLIDAGNDTWSLTIPTPLAEDTYDVTVSITDLAGNTSSDATIDELIIDITPPAIPTVTALITNITTPVIEGTATLAAGENLSISVDGKSYSLTNDDLTANTDGTWILSIPADAPLAENLYQVVATVTDTAGNSATDIDLNDLLIDLTPPAIPAVTAQTTNNTLPVIEGTATVATGESLSVSVDGITYTTGDGNLIDNGDGTWRLSLPTPLTEAAYDVIATLTDAAGNSSSDTTATELIIDTTLPVIPTVEYQITNIATPVLVGTATVAPGEILSVTVDGITYTDGDGTLVDNGDGTWSLAIPTALPNATYQVAVSVTDEADNTSSDVSMEELIIDTVAPAEPTVLSQRTNDTTPIITGSTVLGAGESLSVTVNSVTYTVGDGNLVDTGNDTWTLTVPTPLAEGTYDITATINDLAGNASSDTTVDELIIDTTPPVIPTVTAQITNDSTPVVEGTATIAAGDSLGVIVNGVTYTTGDGYLVENGDGTWRLSLTTPLTDESYDVAAAVTDEAGNASHDPTSAELVIDTILPVVPAVESQITNITKPVLSGTATVATGEILSVTVDGITYTAGDGNLVDAGNDTWTLTIPTPLAEGIYDISATIIDLANNTSSDTTVNELIIDTTPPVIPTVVPLVTNNTMPVILITAEVAANETLAITVDGITYTTNDDNLVDNGDGTWALSIASALPDDTYPVTVTIIDDAGNGSQNNSTAELKIDTVAPNIPTVTTLSTNNRTPVIEGTATLNAGETLTVALNGVTYTVGDGKLTINSDGTWSLSGISSLVDGVYDVNVTITDIAGNSSSDISSGELVIDSTPPATPTADSLTTENTSPMLTGEARLTSGETLSVNVNGVTYSNENSNLLYVADGQWTLQIPISIPIGSYSVQVSASDAMGNTTQGEQGELVIQATTQEPEIQTPAFDFDNDGVPDALDLDDDNDGIPDSVEGERDTDGDGQPDHQDLDSDNDGIADIVEAGGEDIDNDRYIDNFIDKDNDGLSDELQLFPYELIDSDKDRIADYLDVDSDNDGLTDLLESGGIDIDNNGRIDDFSDDNNDGAHDEFSAVGRDTDGDTVFNRLDLDTDNDGLYDLVESGATDNRNDGVLDSMQDFDLDGIPDSVDVDVTAGIDIDGDSIDDRFDSSFQDSPDADGDGIVDQADPDANGDGFADAVMNSLALGQALPDSNGNGETDLLEPHDGNIRTGLQGHGCSVGKSTANKTPFDPVFVLLVLLSVYSLRRRSPWHRK